MTREPACRPAEGGGRLRPDVVVEVSDGHHPVAGPAGQATRLRAPSRVNRHPHRDAPRVRDHWGQPFAFRATPCWLRPATPAAGTSTRRRLELASRTAAVSVVDEIARWSARVRSGEGDPLQLLRMSLADWGHRPRPRVRFPGSPAPRAVRFHDERARRRMLRGGRRVAQLEALERGRDPVRAGPARQRSGELGADLPGSARGLPSTSGAADVDQLFDGRGRGEATDVEQVTAGVLGFAARNAAAAVLDYGSALSDPADDAPWQALTSSLARPVAGLPITVLSVDGGVRTRAAMPSGGPRRPRRRAFRSRSRRARGSVGCSRPRCASAARLACGRRR